MSRVKRGTVARFHHKKILKLSKGYRGRRKNVFRVSQEAVFKSLHYSFLHRIKKRRIFRRKFINLINYFLKKYNINYNFFIYKLLKSNLGFNRLILYKILFFDKFLFFLILKKINCFSLYGY